MVGGGDDQGLRCEKVIAGGMWRCNLMAMKGEVLCEKHYSSVHKRKRNEGDGGGNCGFGGGGWKRKRGVEKISEVDGESGVRKRVTPNGSKENEEERILEVSNGGIGGGKRGRPKGSKNRMEIDLSIDVEKKVPEGINGGFGSGKRRRPKGLKSRKKNDVSIDVEKKVLEGNGGCIGSGKRGRPKSSKSGEKIDVSSDVEKMVLEGNSGCIGSRKRGRPKGKKNKKKIGEVNEVEAMQHGIDQKLNGLGSGMVMLMRDDGDMRSEVHVDDNQSVHVDEGGSEVGGGIVKERVNDTERNDGLEANAPNGNVETNHGMMARCVGRPKGSKNKKKGVNQTEKIVNIKDEVSCGDADNSAASVQRIKRRGRPKGSKNKKKTANHTENIVHIKDEVSCGVQRIERRGRPKGSKNKKKTIDATEKSDWAECDVNGVVSYSGRSKGYKTKKKVQSVIKLRQRMRRYSVSGDIHSVRGWTKKSKSKIEMIKGGYRRVRMQQNQENMFLEDENLVSFKDSGEDTPKREQRGLMCHQCLKSDRVGVIICSNCTRKRYCYKCIAKWYPERRKEEVEKLCPYCCGNCNCKACLQENVPIKGTIKEADENNRLQRSLYLLLNILPVLRQIQQEQMAELVVEASIRGVQVNEEDVPIAIFEEDDRLYCDNCKTSIVNFHRSCPNPACSYDICLDCCSELRRGVQPGGNAAKTTAGGKESLERRNDKNIEVASVDGLVDNLQSGFPKWEAKNRRSIPCPPKEFGGCGTEDLGLKRLLDADWVEKLIAGAEAFSSNY